MGHLQQATRDLMYKAADVVDQYGWTVHDYGNERTGFCAIGALRYAATGTTLPTAGIDERVLTAQGTLTEWLLAEERVPVRPGVYPFPADVIASWNDEKIDPTSSCDCPSTRRGMSMHLEQHARTPAEISAAFRKAADTIVLEDEPDE